MEKRRELNDFQLRNIRLFTYLFEHEAMSDEVTDLINQQEIDYFSLLNKITNLENKVNVDEKTNLLKYKNDYLTNIIKTASRVYSNMQKAKYHVSFIRFDIDDFSKFNNQYGHDIGDKILVKIADTIRTNSRPTDYTIRFGGEEFDVILPATDAKGVQVYCNKIFKLIRKIRVPYGKSKLSVTVSAGTTTTLYTFNNEVFLKDTEIKRNFSKLQKEADHALYEAKSTGKDRWCTYDKKKASAYIKYRQSYKK